jgi:hypothetical protein
MEKEWVAKAADGAMDSEDLLSAEADRENTAGRTSPSWRGLVIAVIAAIVLSVTATLLLGGSFGVYDRRTAGGCGASGNCCPLPGQAR